METEIKKEPININPKEGEILKIDTNPTDAGGMDHAAFTKKYKEKIENISNLQTVVADKVPVKEKGFFAKLKNAYEKRFGTSPAEQLKEDIKDITYIKTVETGLGGLGNMGGGEIWNSLVKRYDIPQNKIDTLKTMLKTAEDMGNGPEKVTLMENIKKAKLEITGMMTTYVAGLEK